MNFHQPDPDRSEITVDYSRPVQIDVTAIVYLTGEEWQAVKAFAAECACSDEEAFFEVMNRAVADAISNPEAVDADFLFENDAADEDEPDDD